MSGVWVTPHSIRRIWLHGTMTPDQVPRIIRGSSAHNSPPSSSSFEIDGTCSHWSAGGIDLGRTPVRDLGPQICSDLIPKRRNKWASGVNCCAVRSVSGYCVVLGVTARPGREAENPMVIRCRTDTSSSTSMQPWSGRKQSSTRHHVLCLDRLTDWILLGEKCIPIRESFLIVVSNQVRDFYSILNPLWVHHLPPAVQSDPGEQDSGEAQMHN